MENADVMTWLDGLNDFEDAATAKAKLSPCSWNELIEMTVPCGSISPEAQFSFLGISNRSDVTTIIDALRSHHGRGTMESTAEAVAIGKLGGENDANILASESIMQFKSKEVRSAAMEIRTLKHQLTAEKKSLRTTWGFSKRAAYSDRRHI